MFLFDMLQAAIIYGAGAFAVFAIIGTIRGTI